MRRIFIVSSEERRAARRNRRRAIARLIDEFEKIKRNLGRYSYKTVDQVNQKISSLLERKRLQGAFDWYIEGEAKNMKLHIAPNRGHLKHLRQLDGVYSLVTNLDSSWSIDELLERYKRQYLSERRFADLKGPLQLRPVFFKKNPRIVGLIFVLYVALMLYCLIERSARSYLKNSGGTLPDPYTGRALREPTARRLVAAFEFYFFYFVPVENRDGELEYLAPRFNPVQERILQSLQIDNPLQFLHRQTGNL